MYARRFTNLERARSMGNIKDRDPRPAVAITVTVADAEGSLVTVVVTGPQGQQFRALDLKDLLTFQDEVADMVAYQLAGLQVTRWAGDPYKHPIRALRVIKDE